MAPAASGLDVDCGRERGEGEGGVEMSESHGLGTLGLSDSDSPNIHKMFLIEMGNGER